MKLLRPHYMLPAHHKWLLKFRYNKKVIDRLRKRAIAAFEFSIREDNSLNYRIAELSVEIIERFWAARYPECITTPRVQVYDLSYRGAFGLSQTNLSINSNLSAKFELPARLGKYRTMWITKDIIDKELR